MNADKRELLLLVGKGTKQEYLDLGFANRHGLIAGATGTAVPTEDADGELERPGRLGALGGILRR